jgi:hypothetical protein
MVRGDRVFMFHMYTTTSTNLVAGHKQSWKDDTCIFWAPFVPPNCLPVYDILPASNHLPCGCLFLEFAFVLVSIICIFVVCDRICRVISELGGLASSANGMEIGYLMDLCDVRVVQVVVWGLRRIWACGGGEG